jgi:hypothetical protein
MQPLELVKTSAQRVDPQPYSTSSNPQHAAYNPNTQGKSGK